MPTTSGESSIAIVCPSRTGVPTSTSSRTTRPENCAKSAVTVFALNSMRPGTDARTGTSPCATALRVEQAEEAALALLIRRLLDGADLGGLLQDVAVEQAQPVAADAVGDDRLLDVGEDLRAHLPPARFGLQLRGRQLRDRRVRAAAGRQRHADGDADSVVGPRSQVLAADGDVARAARVGERHRPLRRGD